MAGSLEWSAGLGVIAVVAAAAGGCNALLDIDHIEFGDATAGGGGSGGSASGAGGGTGGSGNSGGTAGSGGVGGGPAENCHNAVDDNGDGLVDCADPVCSDYRCVPEASSPWSGPVVYHRGSNAESCGGRWPDAAESGGAGTLNAPPASCSSCQCSSPLGDSCPDGDLLFWLQPSCPGAADQLLTPTPPNTCVPVPNASNLYQSVIGATVTPTGGQCTPSGGSENVPPASFPNEVTTCQGAVTGAGCGTGEICAPLPGAPFDQALCIWQDGDHSCPAPFTDKHAFYRSISDTRGCSACTCTPASGGSCNVATEVYLNAANSACSGSPTVIPHDNTCVTLAAPGSVKQQPATPTGGSCNTGGGSPNGSANGSGRVTVCCTP